ncbi:2024_t:CDS:1, partial [Racocetra fulgida]
MAPIPEFLNQYIIKSKEKLNKSNYKIFCKACVEALGEDKGKQNCFPNKTDRVILHLKRCENFNNKTT